MSPNFTVKSEADSGVEGVWRRGPLRVGTDL